MSELDMFLTSSAATLGIFVVAMVRLWVWDYQDKRARQAYLGK